MKKSILFGIIAALGLSSGMAVAGTLDDVKARGNLLCGVSTGSPGFSGVDDSGKNVGFDVDYCRALAAAIFNDPMAVSFVPLSSAVRFTALASGEVDILARNTTWTYSRDTDLKQTFLGVTYYDGQGFMVKKDLGVSSTLELDGATVCIQVGTTTELNLADYFKANNMSYEPVPTTDNAESKQQYLAGACDTYTTDASALHGTRINLENPDDHMVLPEIISKEPLGPLVRHGDDNWADIGRWVLNALVIAEEKGITSANIDSFADTADAEIHRLLGTGDDDILAMMNMPRDAMYNAIKATGNYGEIFERNLGASSGINIVRGVNNSWTNGGILYSPPFR
ncbi:MAG: amino acid ABC transporter substrate-binding protein [Rhodobacteraceae bacterium]|nr:MAG: amino acid ABC transporter substrate-binding protein [Paracoccaceae bacterium]